MHRREGQAERRDLEFLLSQGGQAICIRKKQMQHNATQALTHSFLANSQHNVSQFGRGFPKKNKVVWNRRGCRVRQRGVGGSGVLN
jgi:hypothetical protein